MYVHIHVFLNRLELTLGFNKMGTFKNFRAKCDNTITSRPVIAFIIKKNNNNILMHEEVGSF